jgi:hypothetical protein
VVTAGLRARCQQLFGPVRLVETYGMTETFPMGGTGCAEGHLHWAPAHGLLEVLDPDTQTPAAAGAIGRMVVTPFAPFRETTILLRYDTEDLVEVLPEPLTCPLRHLPATSTVLGKRRLAVRHDSGWTTPRDVLEALESLDVVPLPARCGFWGVPGGVAVEVRVRHADAAVRAQVTARLEESGVPVQELSLVEDPRELRRPLPLRCDLKEAAFVPSMGGDTPAWLDPGALVSRPGVSWCPSPPRSWSPWGSYWAASRPRCSSAGPTLHGYRSPARRWESST